MTGRLFDVATRAARSAPDRGMETRWSWLSNAVNSPAKRGRMPAPLLHFNAFIWPNGYHESAWRVVDDDVRGVLGLAYYAEIGRIAERGLMDSIFLADNIAIPEYRVTHLPQTQFDPVVVLSALAAVTSRIGLIGTGSTTYSKPWDLARRFATLDHMSGGRAGWNIVTTSTPLVAANFGQRGHPEHADRYARAHEFVEAVQRIWDGWEDDAIVGDRERGVWGDRAKLHAPHFHGEHYDVEGILPFPRSPQGWPVLVQAGQSPAGIGLAARYAELVFSGPPSLANPPLGEPRPGGEPVSPQARPTGPERERGS
jgi:FMN-dependent oxidoreductase (nitrilotriacetate monooxygenase family)